MPLGGPVRTVALDTASGDVTVRHDPAADAPRLVRRIQDWGAPPGATTSQDGDRLTLEGRPGRCSVDYELTLPDPDAVVTGVLSSGDPDLSGVASVDLELRSGSARLSGVTGPVTVDASSGDVEGAGPAGDTAVTSSSGSVRLAMAAPASGRVRADSGEVSVAVPAADYTVRATTGSGDLRDAVDTRRAAHDRRRRAAATSPWPEDERMTSAARAAVVDLCRGLVERGLVVGTAGNVSVRRGDRFAVSPSGVSYATLTPDMVGVHALDGTPIDSPLHPTSELALHALVHTRPGARDGEVVLHTHAPASTALSTVVDEVPPTHYYAAFFGGAIRVAPYATFGSPELAAHVLDALRGRTAALMANHGAVLVAPGVDGALDRAGYLEYVCDVALRALATGLPLRTLAAAELDRVADALRRYGQQ